MTIDKMLYQGKIRTTDTFNPQPEIIGEAANVIKSGGVVMFPTRGLYGLGADAANPEAVARVFDIKERPFEKPILVLVSKMADLKNLVSHIPVSAEKIMKRIWPGGVTLVFTAKETISEILTAKTGKIGIRMTEHPVALALCRACDGPITGTSANLSGAPGCKRIEDLDHTIAQRIDLILDAGSLKGGVGSTVVDITVDPPAIIRRGSVSAAKILAVLNTW